MNGQRMERLWLAALAVMLLMGCEEAPFGKSEIDQPDRQSIYGRIRLDRDADAAGVYVWLQGTPLSAFTDAGGEFQLRLADSNIGHSLLIGGVYRLYFYVANYGLESAEVLIQNGRFLYQKGDVDRNGRLARPGVMRKRLVIETEVQPASVASDFQGDVRIRLTLWATDDSVTVVFPKMIGNSLGVVLLQHLGTDSVYTELSDIDTQNTFTAKIGREMQTWEMMMEIFPGRLPPGRYRVIPFLFIQDPQVPEGLLESLGGNWRAPGRDYLRIPFKRHDAILEIQPN
ncbi:MAG: hypothetical protein Q9P14_08575 [candidate division KSB1 bacterium]|nr:hypothetical protein [candidate division KSB1 bacterium]MDQ7065265.1 hypothetical protein [candidate division KSB1 bacterium]